MTEVHEFLLPDVGEGLTEAEVLRWLVAVGDHVAVNDPVVEIETAKAAVELPSPFDGVVVGLLVEPGLVVPVGTPLLAVEAQAPGGTTHAVEADQWAAAAAPSAPKAKRESVLVGYGVAPSTATRRRRRAAPPTAVPAQPDRPRAKPPVRKRAKELGVDLRDVTPTGTGGVVTRADLEGATHGAQRIGRGTDERVPVRGVMRSMAEAMVRSATTAVHVTEWVTVDVTETTRLLERLEQLPELEGAHVGPTVIAAFALCRAARRHPRVNASWDEDGGDLVLHGRVNLGVAAATPRGLVVPVVEDADRLGPVELAHALSALTRDARAGTTTPAAMTGGTITLTNVGVFGVDGGTPILVPGQGAILCLGQVAPRPWVHEGAVVPRSVCELTLSFDHRFVDGELGGRVLADVARTMRDPWPELVRASSG